VAVVGEAHILVKAITTGVQGDIQRAFKGLSGEGGSARKSGESLGAAFSRGFGKSSGSNLFSKISDALATMAPNAQAAAASFARLTRTSFTAGTAISSLIGALGSVIGSLGSLVSAAAIGSASVLGLVGAFVSLRLGAFAAKFALGGISGAYSAATKAQGGLGKSIAEVNKQFKELTRNAESAAMSEKRAALELEKARNNLARMQDLPPNNMARREAQLALEEAELNYRQAKGRSKDLNDELKKGKDGIRESLGGTDPYAGLTKSQKEFAQALVKLKPKFDELKEAVAKGFLPILKEQLDRIFNGPLFPVLKKGLEGIGTALGKGARAFTDYLVSVDGIRKIDLLFKNSEPVIEKFGTILGKVFDGFLGMLEYAKPLVDGFMTLLDDLATGFQKMFNPDTEEGKKNLTDFFAEVSRVAGQFGDIFKNIFGGIGEIIKANTGPGSGADILMKSLITATQGFADLDGSATGKGSLRQYFIDVANNAKPVIGLIGDIVKGLLIAGANPAIGETFEILRKAGPDLQEMFEKAIEAGPSLAELVVSITKFINAFSDSESPKIFFDTINAFVKPLADFFALEGVKAVTDFIGRILAFALALGTVKGAFTLFSNIFLGGLINVFGSLGGIFTGAFGFFKAGGGFDGVRLTIMYFFDAVKGVFGKVVGFFIGLGPKLLSFGGSILGFFGKIGGSIMGVARTLATGIRLLFAANPVGLIITAIIAVIYALTLFFTQTELGKKIWEGFTSFIGDSVKNIGDFFNTLFTNISDGWNDTVAFFKNFDLGQIIKGGLNGLIGFFESLINGIINAWNTGLLAAINNIKLDIPQWVRDAAKVVGMNLPATFSFNLPPAKAIRIPRLADGGTVMPSVGGSLVNVAEAGRPERIEPLDENGLSKRDKVLIAALGGNSGINITVNPSAGMNERDLADMVSRRIAFEIRKGSF
jgi:hypothetical protein